MASITRIVTTAGVIEMASQTDITKRVVDEAIERANATADFLEDLEKAIQEDKE